jgi:hypothetical protein
MYLTCKVSGERNPVEAIRLCERLRTYEDEQDTVSRSMLAYKFHEIGDNTRALHYGNQVLDIEPYNILTLKLLIRIHFDQHEHALVYGYIQRVTSAIPNPEIAKMKSAMTRWLGILIPWFQRLPKLRVILPKLERELKNEYADDSEWLRWAQGYKQWYEERLRSGEGFSPTGSPL